MTIWAILPAAGIGRRMGSITPKQYLPLHGVPVLACALQKLLDVAAIETVVVPLHPEDKLWQTLSVDDPRVETTVGGAERQHSVRNALAHLQDRAAADDWVLVHDAVRPCVTVRDIEGLIAGLAEQEVGGLLGAPLDNTLKRRDDRGRVERTEDRSHYWHALTPQMFRYELLAAALDSAQQQGMTVTDEAAALEAMGHAPLLIEGSKWNIKITHETDLALAEMILQAQEEGL